jgi:thiol-disulfide isomerase/thioredoxin
MPASTCPWKARAYALPTRPGGSFQSIYVVYFKIKYRRITALRRPVRLGKVRSSGLRLQVCPAASAGGLPSQLSRVLPSFYRPAECCHNLAAYQAMKPASPSARIIVSRRNALKTAGALVSTTLINAWPHNALSSSNDAFPTPDEQHAGVISISDLRITYPNGNPFNLSDFRGKVLLLNFWAFWCPHCVSEFQSMISVQQFIGGPSLLSILLVSEERYWSQDQRFAQEHGVPFLLSYYPPNPSAIPVANALLGQVIGNGASYGLPVSYVFTPSGTCALAVRGSQNWSNPQLLPFWVKAIQQ